MAPFLMGQLAAWGLASGALVLSADQETSLTTLLDEIKARRAETIPVAFDGTSFKFQSVTHC